MTRLGSVVLAVALAGCPSTVSPLDGSEPSDVPGLDAPAIDAPTIDAPAIDVPAIDAPSSDAPTIDVPSIDAPRADVPGVCDGLPAATCLREGCIPAFDDACCRACPPGPCADCSDLTYLACQPAGASACPDESGCGEAPRWACGLGAPDCTSAHPVDLDSCDRVGCVPAFPSGEGAPVLSTAVCVPITRDSCTVSCRRLAPPCPTGTYAEGDGSCYTDRCVPDFVCR